MRLEVTPMSDVEHHLDGTLPFGVLIRDGVIAGCWWTVHADPRSASVGADDRDGARASLEAMAILRTPSNLPSAVRAHGVGAGELSAWASTLRDAPGPHDDTGRCWGDLLREVAGEGMADLPSLARSVAASLESMVPAGATPEGERDVLERESRAAMIRRRSAMDAFGSTLDPDAIAAARSFDTLTPWEPDAWRMLDRSFVPDAPLLSAIRAHPMLACLCVDACRADPGAFATAVRAGEVGRVLVDASGLPPHVARRLPAAAEAMACLGDAGRQRLTRAIGLSHLGKDLVVGLASHLDGLPASWVPRDGDGWHAMAACGHVLGWVGSMSPEDRRVALDVGGDWRDFERRLNEVVREGGDVNGALEGLHDTAVALSRQVLMPAAALARGLPPTAGVADLGLDIGDPGGHHDTDHEAHPGMEVLARGRSIVRTIGASTRWHEDRARIQAVLHRLQGDVAVSLCWPAAYPSHFHDPDQPGGGMGETAPDEDFARATSAEGAWRLDVLVTVDQLVSEGARGFDPDGFLGLDHCVGGYADDCRSGRSRIASVRTVADGRWERVCTVEVTFDGDGMPEVRQCRGASNGAPSPAAQGFVASYVARVRSHMLDDLVRDQVMADLAPLPSSDRVAVRAGYEWWIPGRWEAARDAWRALLPRAARDLDPRAMAALVLDGDGMLIRPATWDPEEDPDWAPGP